MFLHFHMTTVVVIKNPSSKVLVHNSVVLTEHFKSQFEPATKRELFLSLLETWILIYGVLLIEMVDNFDLSSM